MDIRRPDLANDAEELDRYYRLWIASESYERPHAPLMSKQELRSYFVSDIATEVFEPYAGYEGDDLVVLGFLIYSKLDNLDQVELYVAVDPPHRRRGHGSAMFEHLLGEVRAMGRQTVLADAWVPADHRDDHPYLTFAAKHGFAVANIEIARHLTLPVADDLLDTWAKSATPHHQDYELREFPGPVDDALVPSLVDAMNQLLVDAPTGDIEVEARGLTPELYQAREDRNAAGGKELIRTLAIAPDGTVAGFTVLAIPLHEDGVVYQYGTLVRRDHRGHRLGLAMKVANLRALQRLYPDRRFVDTCNAETNAFMVGINELMGFRPVEVMAHFQRKLPANPTSEGEPAA